jgi:membrane protein
LRDLWGEVREDRISSCAAAVAYFSMLSIFPAAIFFLSILPYLGIPHLEQAIMELLRQAMPPEASELFTTTVREVVSERHGGLLSFGIIATLWAASSGISSLIEQLDVTYDVEDLRPFWKKRGISLLLVGIFGLLLVVALGLVVFGGLIEGKLVAVLGWSKPLVWLFALFRWIVIVALLVLGLAVMYYFGPDVEQSFRVVTPGSIMGVVLLVSSALGFRTYVEHFGRYEATYGSLGAAIVLLLWLYVGALVILVGSEINALLEHYAAGGKGKGEKKMPSAGGR